MLVLKERNAAGKRSGFKSIGLILAVILAADEWAPERVGHFGAEILTEEDCTEVRCRDFGAFFFLLSLLVALHPVVIVMQPYTQAYHHN